MEAGAGKAALGGIENLGATVVLPLGVGAAHVTP
jgi:hypothetical protein